MQERGNVGGEEEVKSRKVRGAAAAKKAGHKVGKTNERLYAKEQHNSKGAKLRHYYVLGD